MSHILLLTLIISKRETSQLPREMEFMRILLMSDIFLGKGLVNMDAHGISNIGSAHVEVGVGETGLFIPGLTGLFVGKDNHLSTSI